MDDHTDDSDRPTVGTPEELEEALKWLEDLTARQGKPADLSSPVPPASLDSPFRGLIDDDEGDLPDWLREAPVTTDLGSEDEPESRLDWLAKMAQRESIEELPTLEWRRLSEPTQSAILADQSGEFARELADARIDELETQVAPPPQPPQDAAAEVDEATPGVVEGIGDLPVTEGIEDFTTETPEAEDADEPLVVELSEESEQIAESAAEELAHDEPLEAVEDIDEEIDELADEFVPGEFVAEEVESEPDYFGDSEIEEFATTVPDEDLPPLEDLDAAMAWIEELAASQDAPIEDVPSVADRVLASKLMMEAGLPPNTLPLEELGSDSSLVEGLTPTHPFIAEEDFADTIVLVETLAADQAAAEGGDTEAEPPSDRSEARQPEYETEDLGDITPFAGPPDELSFDEAMALLDEMAAGTDAADDEVPLLESEIEGAEEVVEVAAGPPEAETVKVAFEADEDVDVIDDNELIDDPFEGEEERAAGKGEHYENGIAAADWVATTAEDAAAEPTPYDPIEAALLSLDALALPGDRSLDDIDRTLRTAQVSPWRDVESALDWLESALGAETREAVTPDRVEVTPEMDEEAFIAEMPDDPDAVLAWLEQMSEEEADEAISMGSADYTEEAAGFTPETPLPDLMDDEAAELDLLDMPEDPDEAIAWLERLARGDRGEPEAPPPVPEIEEATGEELPEIDFNEPEEALAEIEPVEAEIVDEVVTAEETSEESPESEEVVELLEDAADAAEAELAEATDEISDTPSVAEETLDEAIAEVVAEEPQPEAPKTRRRRSAKAAQPAPEPEAEAPEAEEATDEAAEDSDSLSWLDLLKPLD